MSLMPVRARALACVYVHGFACVCVCAYRAYGEGRNLGIRTRRGPCVASSRACRTDKGWDLTAVQGKEKGQSRARPGPGRSAVQECAPSAPEG